MAERLIVIGGDAGGMAAAAQARRRRDRSQLDIVAFELGEYTSYSACGLPYFVADLVPDADDLIARSPDEHRERGVDVHLRHEVTAIDCDARSIRVGDLDSGVERDEPFDQLVVATGAVPRRPPIPGIEAAGVHGIQTITDGLSLRHHVDAHRGHDRAVVVGGGYIGLEMAEAMMLRGYDVTLLDRNEQPMNTLDPDMGALVANVMRDDGISVHSEEAVTAFDVDAAGHVTAVVTESATYPADVVVLGLGVEPNVRLAHDAGIEIGEAGGVATSARMETSVGGVWAAGDCTEVYDRVARRHTTIALGTHANKQGRVVGVNATGGELEFPGVVGTAVTKVCRYEVARAGLREKDASRLGLPFLARTIDSTTRAGYYPGAQPIAVKLIAERGSGRLLGGQIVGSEGAAKRVDIVAMALWNEMTVGELSQVDLGYAPPFSPTWDPVLIAARVLAGDLA